MNTLRGVINKWYFVLSTCLGIVITIAFSFVSFIFYIQGTESTDRETALTQEVKRLEAQGCVVERAYIGRGYDIICNQTKVHVSQ